MTNLSREKERWIMAKRTLVGLALLGVIGGARAWADNSCNGLIDITYPGAPVVSQVGDVIDVKLSLGAGSISGGTELQLTSVAMNLDCNPLDPLTPPCIDDGPVVSYLGDANITTDCAGINWTSNNPGGGANPNLVVFTATPTLDIPANSPVLPGFCSITFQVQLLALSPEGTVIPELVGYQAALCDNGILDSGGFQTADITTARGFGCYQVPRLKIPAPQPIVKLQDRFGTTTSKPVDFHRFCAPEDKNGEDPTAPASPVHIGGFSLTNTTGTISHPKGLSLTTQFGTLTGDLGNPIFLFTPTSKSLTPPPPAPLPPNALRHFQCYHLANVSGAPKTTGIHLIDQFTQSFGGFTADLNPNGPFSLCVPVDKNDEDAGALTDPQAMVCYRTRNDRLPFNQFTVFATNQFGGFTVTGTQFDELCEPAAIAPFKIAGRRARIRRR